MADLPESARELIESSALAHLVTLNEDGSPQVSIVWVGIEDGEIVCGHLPRNKKVRNIERDDRVALSIETDELSDMGLRKYLVVYGTARITEGGAAELLNRLAQTYMGEGSDFPPMPDPPPGYVTRISVERVAGVGPWAD
jgi:PPOX class probable F420-dependent enzyme